MVTYLSNDLRGITSWHLRMLSQLLVVSGMYVENER